MIKTNLNFLFVVKACNDYQEIDYFKRCFLSVLKKRKWEFITPEGDSFTSFSRQGSSVELFDKKVQLFGSEVTMV